MHLDRVLANARVACALRRLELLDELPTSCVRTVLRGVRATWFRVGPVLLLIVAGDIVGAWVISPWDAPVRFGDEHVAGFTIATPDISAVAVGVIGTHGHWCSIALDGLLELADFIDARLVRETCTRIAQINEARDAIAHFFSARQRSKFSLVNPPAMNAAATTGLSQKQQKKVARGST